MTDPNLLYSPEHSVDLLSKSSPSQLRAFQFKGSCTQSFPIETLSLEKPSKLSHVPCKFFKQGTCTAGANCTFSHSSDVSSESSVCRYFIKGNCKFGTKCALLHTMSPYSVDQKIRLNERSWSASSSFTLDDNPVWHPRELHSSHTSFDTSPFYWNSSFEDDPSGLHQHKEEEEINDAMLPSSLNDLFTPLELHSRRVKQEGYASMSEPPLGSTWRVPFITKNDWLDGASNTRGHIEDEDVQFFMDEVEGIHQSMENTLSSLFQNKMKMNQNNNIHHGLL